MTALLGGEQGRRRAGVKSAPMSAPVPYFEVVRQMPNAFDYRLRLVTHARQQGIKAAARTDTGKTEASGTEIPLRGLATGGGVGCTLLRVQNANPG